jgi:hypothetical protein
LNAQLLVDAIVRQTTVLIAQLATSHGLRAPLAHLANQVFFDLSRELETQGISRKVSADMFGMALRAYLKKIQRLSESSTDRGRSLWEAVYDFLRSRGVVSRDAVIQRFSQDDEALVRGALHDLSESGLVFCTGSSANAMYRAATDEELGELRQQRRDRIDELLWAIVYNEGPIGRADLARLGRVNGELLDAALGRLVESDRIERVEANGAGAYVARRFYVPVGAETGWEAAVFDHFHAVVKTICTKLQLEPKPTEEDRIGGSTYSLILWDGHPLEAEVLSFLQRFRSELVGLRERVREHNDGRERPETVKRVVIYGGQCVTEEERDT